MKDLAQQAARLHDACLPGSLLSKLGPSLTGHFYAFALSSNKEKVFYEANPGLQGVAVLSMEPDTLMKRFFLECTSRPGLLLSLPFTRPAAVVKTALGIVMPEKAPEKIHGLPEVVHIYTGHAARRQGIGKNLLAQVEQYLARLRVKTYFLKTENLPQNQALAFYKASGFERAGVNSRNVYFTKPVAGLSS